MHSAIRVLVGLDEASDIAADKGRDLVHSEVRVRAHERCVLHDTASPERVSRCGVVLVILVALVKAEIVLIGLSGWLDQERSVFRHDPNLHRPAARFHRFADFQGHLREEEGEGDVLLLGLPTSPDDRFGEGVAARGDRPPSAADVRAEAAAHCPAVDVRAEGVVPRSHRVLEVLESDKNAISLLAVDLSSSLRVHLGSSGVDLRGVRGTGDPSLGVEDRSDALQSGEEVSFVSQLEFFLDHETTVPFRPRTIHSPRGSTHPPV